jgi:hypothetical protein
LAVLRVHISWLSRRVGGRVSEESLLRPVLQVNKGGGGGLILEVVKESDEYIVE